MDFIKPLGEDSTPGTVKPLPVSLVQPVAYPLSYLFSIGVYRRLSAAFALNAVFRSLLSHGQARLPATYCTLALITLDAPCLLVRVTDTLVIPAALPLMVKGCVKVNWLPN